MKKLFKKVFGGRLSSRRFWMAIVAALVPVFNAEFGWGLDNEQVMYVVAGLVSFVVGESYADANRM